MKKQWLLTILIIGAGAGGFWYMKQTRPAKQPLTVQEQSWRVEVQPITRSMQTPQVTLYARIESPREITLRAPSLSIAAVSVAAVAVREGETVKAGQVLMRLEETDTRLLLQQREADIADIQAQIEIEKQDFANNNNAIANEEALLALIRRSVERAKQLEQQKVGSTSALEEAQRAQEQQTVAVNNRRSQLRQHRNRLAQLQARLDRAIALRDIVKLELERTQITAPFAGIISQVNVTFGDRVRNGDALLELYDNQQLEARAQIPSHYYNLLLNALANQQTLTAQATIADQTLSFQLNRLAGRINLNSGGIEGLFQLMAGKEWLRSGQFINLVMNLPPQSEIIAVPYRALYGVDKVYKLVDGRMRGVTVERVGEMQATTGEMQILLRSAALQADDRVITTQLPNAMDGLKVEVSNL